MKIVVIGGSGLIGKRLVNNLRERGHDARSASPSSGVNSVTGEGVSEVLAGAQVVVDVSNSPSFEDEAVLKFFESSTTNLLAAAKTAGVQHYLALSVVSAERLPRSGYMRAKIAQEKLIKASQVPYTIVRATQFFEFVESIAGWGVVGDEVRLPPAQMKPIAAADVSDTLTGIVVNGPRNATLDLAGPDAIRMDELVQRLLNAKDDNRRVIGDPHANYFGAEVDDQSLVPGGEHLVGVTHFDEWLSPLAIAK